MKDIAGTALILLVIACGIVGVLYRNYIRFKD
jgi:hypothetical protein